MSKFVTPIPANYEPVIVVVRFPDYEDEIYQFGLDHRVIYLDLGGPFDITDIGSHTPETEKEDIREWAASTLADVANLPDDHPARAEVERQVDEILFLISDGTEPANKGDQ